MLIVHGTAAFRDRVPGAPPEGAESTTELGAWYGTLLRWRKPVAVLMNGRTLLPVLMPLAPARTLLQRLPEAAAEVMTALDLPPAFVEAETAAMREVRLAPTADRSLVGVLTEFGRLLEITRGPHEPDLLERSLWLAKVPSTRIGYRFPADEVRDVVEQPNRQPGGVRTVRRAASSAQPPVPPPAFPPSSGPPVRWPAGVRHQPGLADGILHELKPLLAADGIDLDDPDNPPGLQALQAAMGRAVERRDLELFTPIGARRTAAVTTLLVFSAALVDGRAALAEGVLAAVRPESHDETVAEVSAVIGLALGLLDDWLTGRVPGVPEDLAASVRVPPGWKRTARPATEILALAARGRAFSAHGPLVARQGGEQVLGGAAVAVAAAAQTWARRTGVSMGALLPTIVR